VHTDDFLLHVLRVEMAMEMWSSIVDRVMTRLHCCLSVGVKDLKYPWFSRQSTALVTIPNSIDREIRMASHLILNVSVFYNQGFGCKNVQRYITE